MKIRKNINLCIKKWEEKYVDLLLIGKGKKGYVLINDFNRFIDDHLLHRRRKHFCRR